MSIVNNLEKIKNNISENVEIVAVSKTHSPEVLMELYNSGHKVFGENKVQELIEKEQEMPKDIEWHMIGHLQRNKVKYIAPYVHLIHSVDSLRLLNTINKEGEKNNRIISVLFQLHIADEESKFGLNEIDYLQLIEEFNKGEHKFVKVLGVMGMSTFTEDKEQVRDEFKKLKLFFEKGKKLIKESDSFTKISMGMTDDYQIAIEEGSTIVRVGSAIFGSR